jgi:hypothetical protein
MTMRQRPCAAANRHPAGQSDGLENFESDSYSHRAFPAAVAEFGC